MAYGVLFREENVIILEARSILYAVRYAESKYPTGHLLIVSDNLALVLVLCKGRSFFSLLSVMCRIFASGFQAGVVFSFTWVASELNCFDKGSRCFDREYDSNKSLLHVLAQPLPRFLRAQTRDKACLFLKLIVNFVFFCRRDTMVTVKQQLCFGGMIASEASGSGVDRTHQRSLTL